MDVGDAFELGKSVAQPQDVKNENEFARDAGSPEIHQNPTNEELMVVQAPIEPNQVQFQDAAPALQRNP